MNAAVLRLIGIAALLAVVAGGAAALTWQFQDLRYGQPLPKPAAWFMEACAPDLTRRMLNELSGSPTKVTED